MNSDSTVPIPQLMTAIATPSASTICRTDALEAPMARRTPTSRTRSIMLMLMVVASPSPPTAASSNAIRIRNATTTVNSSLFSAWMTCGRLGAADFQAQVVEMLVEPRRQLVLRGRIVAVGPDLHQRARPGVRAA